MSDAYDEVRDSHSLNEFLAQPKLSEEMEAMQWLLGQHPDQIDPRFLCFTVEGIRYHIPLEKNDVDGSKTELKAEELVKGKRVYLKKFTHNSEGEILN